MALRGGSAGEAQVLQPLTRNAAPDTKTGTHTTLPSSASSSSWPQLPSAAQLATASDTQLLPLLFDAYKLLRMTAAPYHVAADVLAELLAPRLLKHSSPEVSQLVGCVLCDLIRLHSTSPTLLTTTTTTTNTTSTTSNEDDASLPFAAAYCADILHCFVRPFRALLEARTAGAEKAAAASWTLQRCGYLIERLSASHALPHILPHCEHRAECEELLQNLFDVVPCAQQQQQQRQQQTSDARLPAGRNTSSSSSSSSPTSSLTTSSVTCAEMARVLLDVLELHNCMSPAQLQPLLQSLVQTSRALHAVQVENNSNNNNNSSGGSYADKEGEEQGEATLTWRSTAATGREDGGNEKSAASAAATIAARVLVEACDMVQPCVVAALMPEFERGVEELCAAETQQPLPQADLAANSNTTTTITTTTITAGNNNAVFDARLESRRRGLRAMAHTMEAFVALVEVHVPLVEQLMPRLQLYLQHDHGDVRLLTLRGFYSAFMASEALVRRYRGVLETLLVRAAAADARPSHRTEMLQGVTRLLRHGRRQGWRPDTLAAVWSAVQPVLEQRLVDVRATVRQQAVQSYCEALLLLFSHTNNHHLNMNTSNAMSETTKDMLLPSSETLARTLGLRTADKHIRVREAAVVGLTRLYRQLLWAWIPNAVFAVAWAEAGPRLLECTLERLLPPPTQLAPQASHTSKGNTASAQVSPRASTGALSTANAVAAAQGATLAVFEFEKEALRSGRSYVDALVQLCTDLSETMRPQLLRLVRRKAQLRQTISALFTLRLSLASRGGTATGVAARAGGSEGAAKSREEQAALVDKTHRLLTALREVTHAERGEWDTLFRAKDEAVGRALLQACAAHHVNWYDARTALLRSLQGRLDATCDHFVRDSLCTQLCLPLQRAHLEQLVDALLQAVPDTNNNIITTIGGEKNDKEEQQDEVARTTNKKRRTRSANKRKDGAHAEADADNNTTSAVPTMAARGIETEAARRYISGLFVTLQVFVTASPSYLPLCVPALLTLLARLAALHTNHGPCVPLAWWRTVLQCLQDWSDYVTLQQQQQQISTVRVSEARKTAGLKECNTDKDASSPEYTSPPLTAELKQATMQLLHDLCLGTRPWAQGSCEGGTRANEEDSEKARAAFAIHGQLAKHAARGFLALLAVPHFGEPALLTSLVEALRRQLHEHIRGCTQLPSTHTAPTRRTSRKRPTTTTTSENAAEQQQQPHEKLSDEALLATLSALRSFAKHSLSAPLLHHTSNGNNDENDGSALQDMVTLMDILLRSPVRAACDRLKLQRNGTVAAAANTNNNNNNINNRTAGAEAASNTTTPVATATEEGNAAQDNTTNTAPIPTTTTTTTTITSTLPCSMQSALIDATAKAMSALALGIPVNITTSTSTSGDGEDSSAGSAVRRGQAVSRVLDCLLQGYKTVCGSNNTSVTLPVNSVGACQRRLALAKQMTKLLIQPSPDIGKELAVAVVLSTESERVARRVLQRKLAFYVMQDSVQAVCGVAGRCDMRYAALLFLTAMSEDSRGSFQELRVLVQRVGDCLQARRLAEASATLNAPAAMYCYLEYTVPFLVLFMAHHPLYTAEKTENHFVAFQRVWHLLIDELLRHNTQCVGVLSEILGRIKQSDDLLDRASDASRVLCDLGSKVLWQCLGQRQISAEVLRRYAGPLLMPSFFVKTTQGDPRVILETSYLDPNLRVATSAPFRIPSAAGNAAQGMTEEVVTATTSVSHRASVDNNDEEAEDEVEEDSAKHAAHTHSKRGRTEAMRALTPPSHPHRGRREASQTSSPSITPQPSRHARTERTATANANSTQPSLLLLQRRVDEVVQEMTQGCSKAVIAQMRWKTIRARVAAELDRVPAETRAKEGLTLEAMLERAKVALRAQYERAAEQ